MTNPHAAAPRLIEKRVPINQLSREAVRGHTGQYRILPRTRTTSD